MGSVPLISTTTAKTPQRRARIHRPKEAELRRSDNTPGRRDPSPPAQDEPSEEPPKAGPSPGKSTPAGLRKAGARLRPRAPSEVVLRPVTFEELSRAVRVEAIDRRITLSTGQTGAVGDAATYRLDGHVATITYNRPDVLNAINADMRNDLNEAFARFRDEEEAWVAIVTGSGRAFCVGADLRQGGGSAGAFPGTFWEKPTLNSFESGWEIFKPVIAAVNGYCLGYGLTLATWCDFVLASDRAEFGLPEVGLGVPAIVASIRLPQRLNWADAMEILLTGERIDADRARAMGLVWRVVPHDTLLDEANALAERLLGGAPLAQRAMKEMAMRTRHMAPLEAIRFGETMRHVAAASQDATEGFRAAAEGRPPRWTGR